LHRYFPVYACEPALKQSVFYKAGLYKDDLTSAYCLYYLSYISGETSKTRYETATD